MDVAATTGGVAATVSNPMTAAEETVAEEIGIAPSATIPTSPSGPNATAAVSPVATLEDPLETIDGVDLTVAAATVMVVSSGGTTVATETVVATNPSQAIGPATIAAPTISRAGRRATSVDLTLRTVAATGAVATAEVHAKAKASEAATVVATIAEARGKTVVAVGRAAFDQKGPSVRHRVSLVGTLTTVGQNPSADGAVMTIEGGAYG